MFASGFVLVSLAFVAAFICRASGDKEPEWVPLVGGGAFLCGFLLMVGSVLTSAARFLWRVLP